MKETVELLTKMMNSDYKIDVYRAFNRKSDTKLTLALGCITNVVRKYMPEDYSDLKMGKLLNRERTTILYYRNRHSTWLLEPLYQDMYEGCKTAIADMNRDKIPYDVHHMLQLARLIAK